MSRILAANIMQTIERQCSMYLYKGENSPLIGTVSQKPLKSFQKSYFKLKNTVNMREVRLQKLSFEVDLARIQIGCRHEDRTQSSEKKCREENSYT